MTSFLQVVTFRMVRESRTSSVDIAVQALIYPLGALGTPVAVGEEAQHVVVTYIVAQRVREQLLRVFAVVEHLLVFDAITFAILIGEDADFDAGVFPFAHLAGVQAGAVGVGDGVGECSGG